jgi:hypothetical protein
MTLSKPIAVIFALTAAALTSASADEPNYSSGSILAQLATSPKRIVSTIPYNGDLNPYGVAFVPGGFPGGGLLTPGDILVSNFNDSQNAQGTGTTIVNIPLGAPAATFFQGKTGLGLTTALGVLRAGYVIVGNVPTYGASTAGQGSLLVIDRYGNLVTTVTNASLLDGPWDLAIYEHASSAQIFVSNVLNGTVSRVDVSLEYGEFQVVSVYQIAQGYAWRTDPSALVVGPTGLAYDPATDVLYVASTGDNEIFSIPYAGHTNTAVWQGTLVYKDNTHLHGPLGLRLAPNGHLITTNGDAVNPGGTQNALVEFTTSGQFVAQYQLDSGAGGAAFGLAIGIDPYNIRFAAVDDNQNTLDIWVLP